MAKTLINSTLVYALGNAGSRILTMAVVPMYTFFIGVEEMGWYEVVLTTVSLLVPVFNVQVDTAMLRWLLGTEKKYADAEAISSALAVVLGMLGVATVVYCAAIAIADVSSSGWVFGFFFVQCLYPVVLQVSRGQQDNLTFVLAGLGYSACVLVFNVLAVAVFKLGLPGVFLANTLAGGAGIVVVVWRRRLWRSVSVVAVRRELVREYCLFGLPLIPNAISWWLISGATTFMILGTIGVSANGIFGISSKFVSVLAMGETVFMLAWTETAILRYGRSDQSEYFSSVLRKYLMLLLYGGVLFIPASKIALSIIIAPDFHSAWDYVPILYIGVVCKAVSSFLGVSYLCTKRTGAALRTTFIGASVALVGGILLIPTLGLWGAAVTVVLGQLGTLIARALDTSKEMQLSVRASEMVWPIVGATALSLVLPQTESALVVTGFLVVATAVFYWKNREIISAVATSRFKGAF